MRIRTPNPCSVLRANPQPGQGTVLVLGTPRGGTSVLAGICHMLGVPMGLNIDESNMEDREFAQVLASEDIRSASQAYFRRLRALGSLAGAKSPIVIDRLAEFYDTVPQPLLVVITRDVVATAQREETSGNELRSSLDEVIRRKYAMLKFVDSVDAPLLVVSYERLIQDPADAIRLLAQFLLGSVADELVLRTSDLVRPHADMPHEVNFVTARREFERLQRSIAN